MTIQAQILELIRELSPRYRHRGGDHHSRPRRGGGDGAAGGGDVCRPGGGAGRHRGAVRGLPATPTRGRCCVRSRTSRNAARRPAHPDHRRGARPAAASRPAARSLRAASSPVDRCRQAAAAAACRPATPAWRAASCTTRAPRWRAPGWRAPGWGAPGWRAGRTSFPAAVSATRPRQAVCRQIPAADIAARATAEGFPGGSPTGVRCHRRVARPRQPGRQPGTMSCWRRAASPCIFRSPPGVFRHVVGHVRAVDGVSFDIGRGETLGLVGESGCGKSTTGRLLLRLLRATGGSVRFEGAPVFALQGEALRVLRRDMQIVFQDPFSLPQPAHDGARHARRAVRDPRPAAHAAARPRTRAAAPGGARAPEHAAPLSATSSPAASASASALPAPWRWPPSCWYATNRCRRSTCRSRRRS